MKNKILEGEGKKTKRGCTIRMQNCMIRIHHYEAGLKNPPTEYYSKIVRPLLAKEREKLITLQNELKQYE